MTKKEFIEAMKDLDDEAEISIFCSCSGMGIEGYASDIYFENKLTGDDVMNEITIVAVVDFLRSGKMEFDKSRVYTAVNADEVPIGSKCIFADDLNMLRKKVQHVETFTSKLIGIRKDCELYRFRGASDEQDEGYALAYLLKEPQYKPFSSVEKAMEAIKKHGGWIKDKITENQFFVNSYCRDIISTKTEWLNMQELFRKYVFIDDDSPCGEIVES